MVIYRVSHAEKKRMLFCQMLIESNHEKINICPAFEVLAIHFNLAADTSQQVQLHSST